MTEEQSNIVEKDTIPDKLYKYKSFSKPEYYEPLFKGKIFLAIPSSLNDPFDSKIPILFSRLESEEETKSFFKKTLTDIESTKFWHGLQKIKEKPNGYNDTIFSLDVVNDHGRICSLAPTNKNLILWGLYTDSHQGFCIEYDSAKLDNFLSNSNKKGSSNYILQKVNYSKTFPLLLPRKSTFLECMSKLFFTKSIDWESEEEWRILHTSQKMVDPDLLQLEPEIITGIYYGLNTNKDLIDNTKSIAKKFNPDIKLFKGKKDILNYSIKFEEL